jgi:hypothetical protein
MSRMMSILLIVVVSLALTGCKKSGTAKAPSPTRPQGGTARETQPPTTVGGGQQGATAGGQQGTTAGGQQGATAGGQAGAAAGQQPGAAGEQEPTTVSTKDRAKVQETGAKTGGTQK